MKDLPACPECESVLTYEDGAMLICPECGHEWTGNSIIGIVDRHIRKTIGDI